MNAPKQKNKTSLANQIILCLGLIFSLAFVFQFGNPQYVSAHTREANRACQAVVENVQDPQGKRTYRDDLDACYYGYENLGDSQNPKPACIKKYPNREPRQLSCIAGSRAANQAQRDASPASAPSINECQNSSNPKKCKKEYRDCNKKAGAENITSCKKAVLKKYEKADGKGGGGGGGGAKAEKNGAVGSVGKYQCGNMPDADNNFKTKINFGCLGDKGPLGLGPIQDLAFALIRFASIGVGIVITIAMIAAGIQYSMAEGNPEAAHKAKVRAREALIGLFVYIFAFSILQFLIPGGLFK